jgi:hypothetical protein
MGAHMHGVGGAQGRLVDWLASLRDGPMDPSRRVRNSDCIANYINLFIQQVLGQLYCSASTNDYIIHASI